MEEASKRYAPSAKSWSRPMTAKLYDLELSGNCYKVRLLSALLGVPVDIVPVDFMAGAHKKSPLINLNPFGEIPIFVDGDVVLRDSHAILVYIARKWGSESWLPTDPSSLARVVSWLMVAENEIARGPADARLHDKFGYKLDVTAARAKAARILGILEEQLQTSEWLALGRPTIADIACMPYVALGHEGGVPFESYPAIKAWVARIKRLPGYIPMPAI
jgi:glutathione S-transferase